MGLVTPPHFHESTLVARGGRAPRKSDDFRQSRHTLGGRHSMPQLPAGVLYGVPALLAGQIVLTMAEQIPADAGWAGFTAGLLGTAGGMLMGFGARQIRPGWRLSTAFAGGGFLALFGRPFFG